MLTIDNSPVTIRSDGTLLVKVGGQVYTSPSWEGLKAEVQSEAEARQEKRQRAEASAARREAFKPVPVWAGIRLVPYTYRGRHARTNEALLTSATGDKTSSRMRLYVDVTPEQVDEANRIADKRDRLEKLLKQAEEKAVTDSKLHSKPEDMHLILTERKRFSGPVIEVARIPFAFDEASYRFTATVNGEPFSAESAYTLGDEAVRRMHPWYGQPVWIINTGARAWVSEEPVPFLGSVSEHSKQAEGYVIYTVFASEQDADEYLDILLQQREARAEQVSFLDSLTSL